MKLAPNIEDKKLADIALLFNKLLANEYVLYTKTRSAHWNVRGPNFIGLHDFFKAQYVALDTIVDNIGERIRALGQFVFALLKDFSMVLKNLDENSEIIDQKLIMQSLIKQHKIAIKIIRNEIIPMADRNRDLSSTDFAINLIEQHEKMIWMLRAHLSEN